MDIVFKINSDLFYLGRVEHNINDGSVYWFGNIKKKDSHIFEKIKVSYHTSGRVNWHFASRDTYTLTALTEISKRVSFFTLGIPELKALEIYSKTVDENVLIVPVEYCEGRWLIDHFVFPVSDNTYTEIPYIQLNNYLGFSVSLLPANPSPLKVDKMSFQALGGNAIYLQTLQKDKFLAKTEHLQKIYQNNNLMIVGPDTKGEFKIIFTVPMRIPPRIEVTFTEKGYFFKEIFKDLSEARITIHNIRKGKVLTGFKISSCQLDAEI